MGKIYSTQKIADGSKFRRDRGLKVKSARNSYRKQQKTKGKNGAKKVAKGYNLKGNRGDPKGGPKKIEKRCFGWMNNQSEMDLEGKVQI